ncbi:hypothetical protein Ahy_A08g039444 isoform A [Arachis hypogaea]|uniref:40S ribosomal protein S27 n=1 Tax=Arachis hypogaea TaxID=3818 RepID=A0A445BWT3_ARAHY|nr:hypothetical protein Ahy_A08g039444 isoform A [Arachis hypogaea]
MVLQNDIDLLNPPAELEKRKHKLKRLVQSPNSFFTDVKCQGCFNIYVLNDGHSLLVERISLEPGDPSPYSLLIWICRTWLWHLEKRIAYFGTGASSILKDPFGWFLVQNRTNNTLTPTTNLATTLGLGVASGKARPHPVRNPSFGGLVLQNDIDLLNPPAELEKRKHKLKRLVQSPNSFFMDVKCQGCFNITTVFSHSQTVVVCGNCQTVLCQPTGGRARLTEGCSFRKKGD